MVRGYNTHSTAQDEGTPLVHHRQKTNNNSPIYHFTMETTDSMEQSSLTRCTVEELVDSVPKLKQESCRLDVNVVYTAFWECMLK